MAYRLENFNNGTVAFDTPFTGPGTFIFHSGTHPQKQVYMGLAGLITQDHAAGEAYPNVPYNNEVTLFYSDIDTAFNEAVAAGTLTTAIERQPTWFLVNGEPYEANVTAGIDAGAAGENVLLRLASTATDTPMTRPTDRRFERMREQQYRPHIVVHIVQVLPTN